MHIYFGRKWIILSKLSIALSILGTNVRRFMIEYKKSKTYLKGDGDMKSKVLNSSPLELAVAKYPWQAMPDQKKAQEQIYQIRLKYKHYEEGNVVESGDVAAVTMESEHKKFNRTLKLQVGSNMFDKELEAALVGKQVNTDYVLEHSVGTIRYRIGNIQRLVVPELDDEMAVQANIEGVSTAAALEQYYIEEELKKDLRNEAFDFLPDYLMQWDVELSPSELEEMDEREMERCRGISRSMDMVFDEMTEEQLLGAVGCHNIPEFRKMIHSYHRKALTAMLAEATISGKATEKLALTDANLYYGALLDRVVCCALKNIGGKTC